jgi:hypothetical protein
MAEIYDSLSQSFDVPRWLASNYYPAGHVQKGRDRFHDESYARESDLMISEFMEQWAESVTM